MGLPLHMLSLCYHSIVSGCCHILDVLSTSYCLIVAKVVKVVLLLHVTPDYVPGPEATPVA